MPAVVAVLALALMVAPAGTSMAVAAAGPTLALSPAVGPPTTTTTASGSGFAPDEMIDLSVGGQAATTTAAGSGGGFAASLQVPAGALPGVEEVVATGEHSDRRASAPFVVDTDWPMIGFSATRTGVNPYENVLGPADVSGLQEAWQSLPGDESLNAPVAADGVVYTVDTVTDVIYAVDERSGALRWQHYLGAYTSIPSTAAVSGGVVYVGDGGGLHALSAATGVQRWVFPTDGWASADPLVSGGVVYTGTVDGVEYAVNSATGKQLWSFAHNFACLGPAALAGRVVYFSASCGDAGAYALNARSYNRNLWMHHRLGGAAYLPH